MKKFLFGLLMATSGQSMAAGICQMDSIQAEDAAMETSPYWQHHLERFADQMNQVLPRGCEFSNRDAVGLEMFMDDLEFAGPTDQSRILAYSGHYNTDWKSSRNQITISPADPNLHQPGVTVVHIYLKKGFMSFYAKSCSKKEILSQLLAYTPYALSAACGANRQMGPEVGKAIQAEAGKILQGDRGRESASVF